MSLRTVLFTFKLNSSEIEFALNSIQSVLRQYFPSLTKMDRISFGDSNGFLVVFTAAQSDDPVTFTLRYYQSEQLFTLNGEVTKTCKEFSKFNNFKLENLQEELERQLKVEKQIERLPVLRRNSSVPLYFYSSDHRVQEYDFDDVLVNEKSQYQDIKILHSPTLGNTLVLDGIPNMSDSDLIYTRSLMNYGANDFKDKEILILGGGDGGLLHELLKESPKFVTMVEIDNAVIEHCRKHLRAVCGTTLDSFIGINFEVIVGDCFAYMRQYIEQGKQFDYVFNDLTDLPFSTADNKDFYHENLDEMWQFVKQILQLAWKLVRADTGKYLNHANGVGSQGALEQFEQILKTELTGKAEFTRRTAFIPSFMEDWVFYEVSKI